MQKKNLLRNGLIFGMVLLFAGVIIQSTGILEEKDLIIDRNTYSSSGLYGTNDQSGLTTKTGDRKDLTNSTIVPFLNKLTTRFPLLKNIGKQMGWTKQTATQIMKKFGNENIIKTYIALLSRLFNL